VDGARQDDLALGDPRAPITIIEYADLRCAECAALHRDVLPELIRRNVRSGRVRLELRQLPLYGPRSRRLAQAAFAAARQDHYWEFVQLAYLRASRRPGTAAESPARLAAGLGLDVPRWRADLDADEWSRRLLGAASVATAARLPSIPVFLVRRGVGPLTVLAEPSSIADFGRAIGLAAGEPYLR
jgi:hypothetical protein